MGRLALEGQKSGSEIEKSLDEFLAIFEPFDGSAANALRKALEPLTK